MRTLNEHGPKDLFKAYHNSDAPFAQWWDLEKSKFTELSKEEALKYISDKDNDLALLHMLIGKHLVYLDSRTGNGFNLNSVLVPEEKGYTTPDGRLIRVTSGMPAEHLIKIADKIYLVDPVNYEQNPDREQHRLTQDSIVQTALNSYVGRFSSRMPRGLNDGDYYKDNLPYSRSVLSNINTKKAIADASSLARAERGLEIYRIELEHALRTANGNKNDETVISLQQLYDQAKERVDNIKQQIRHDNFVAKDTNAITRNAESLRNLQGVRLSSKFNDLRKSRVLRARIQNAEHTIDEIKQKGADSTILKKKQLEDARKRLSQLKYDLDMVEDGFAETDAADALEIAEIQEKQEDINNKLKQIEDDFLNKFNQIKTRRGG